MKHRFIYPLFAFAAVITGVVVNVAFSSDNKNSAEVEQTLQLVEGHQALLSDIPGADYESSEIKNKESDDDKKMRIIESREKQLNSQKLLNKAQEKLIESLRLENEKLKQQISSLEHTVKKQSVYITDHKASLRLAREKMRLLTSNSAQVKETITKLPDMMRLKVKSEKPTHEIPAELEEPVEGKQSESGFSLAKVSGSVEFGFKYEQDNETTKHLQGKLTLDYDEPDKYNVNNDLDFEFENQDSKNSTEKYRWQLQGDYNLDPSNLVFIRSDITRSRYASYSKEDVYTLGYGRVFNGHNHKLNIELGPGYRFSSPNFEEDEDVISIDEFIIRTRFNYERIISENLQFKMDTAFEIGAENSIYETTLKAQNRIYHSLFLVFDFGYKYTKLVPADMANDEIKSGMKLLYAF
ncbi:MAG: DUF481 domain-containing protein [Psychromonas sp.]|nr:DUF481 domain-containing protein [Psychromonas sp.]